MGSCYLQLQFLHKVKYNFDAGGLSRRDVKSEENGIALLFISYKLVVCLWSFRLSGS